MKGRKNLTQGIHHDFALDDVAVRDFVTQSASPPTSATTKSSILTPTFPTLNSSATWQQLAVDSGRIPATRVGLIPVTVRLHPELATRLRSASLQRQLAGEPHCTQQEIVAAALEQWLAAHPVPKIP